jgi:sulfotransferase family protein
LAASEAGRGWSGYSYAVPGQWQGRVEHLRVVGDKKGGASTIYLACMNPSVIDKLRKRLGQGVGLRVIFYHRNPFDVSSTIVRRTGAEEVPTRLVEFAFDRLVPAVARLRDRLAPAEVIEVFHEDFVAGPRAELRRVIEAIGEEASDSFLGDASSIVKESPYQSRKKISWASDIITLVERKVKAVEFLQRYSFES